MNLPPGLTCAACRLPFDGKTARRTYNGFIHAKACASRTNLTDGAWVMRRGVMVWQQLHHFRQSTGIHAQAAR